MYLSNHQTSMFHSLLMIITFFVIFLLTIPSATPLYFNFPSLGPKDTSSINVAGDAYISNQGIQLTPEQISHGKVGQATYSQPLHLWDKGSAQLANFTTHFSFVIDSLGESNFGDGLAFFVAPVGSGILPGSAGGALGLTSGNLVTNSSANHFVAVEFDTFQNGWDPCGCNSVGPHVGININSMASVRNVTWGTYGNITDAWISYDSIMKNLSVVFTNFSSINETEDVVTLSYVVDLSKYLPEWVIIGFSSSTGQSFEKNNIKSWEFNSTNLVDSRAETPSPQPQPNIAITGKKINKLMVGLIVGGSCVLVAGLALVCFVILRRKKRGKRGFGGAFMDDEFDKGIGPRKFSYVELSRATNNFSEEQKLGEGGFGGVYKAFLKELNSYVAVKRMSRELELGLKEYASEVKIFSRLRHRNLVKLIGWCHDDKRKPLLVYEFLPNGSLDQHLFKGRSLLKWEDRYKIAQGLASALLYLHEEWEQCVVHRDIKSSNVMLDSSFNAKLGDFGLARLVEHGKGSQLQTTVVAGTYAYIAPECASTGKASKESDVYSFGVVALEIACGRIPIDPMANLDQIKLVDWVSELHRMGKILEAADQKLGEDFDEQQMKCLMIVGLWCAQTDSNRRPAISQVIHVLNFEVPLPDLPSNSCLDK